MLNVKLKEVMTQGYLYVQEHESTGKALGVMRDMNISSVFVLNNDRPVGIITERRIIERAVKGVNVFTAPVAQIMSSPLKALNIDTTIGEACAYMTKEEVRHLGVVDFTGGLRGTLTPGNIVNMLGSESFSSTAQVKDVMYPKLVVETPKSTVKEAAEAILEKRGCCVIVMDGDYPAGLVSEKDIARCISYGQGLASITLDKIMSVPVIGVGETDTVAQGIITLRSHRIHRVLVYNQAGKVSGILALNNLVRNIDKVLH